MDLPLYEQIYNYLVQKIRDGELSSGDRVPSEKELAEQFQVSRITSKKALELLAMHRLVERVQGKGSFVAESLPDLSQVKPLHDYEPSGSTGKSRAGADDGKIIAFVLPDFGDSYGLRLIHGVEERCSKLGIKMFLKLTYDRPEEEEEAIRSFLRLGVDGFIVFPVHGEHYNSELLRLVLDKHPLVLIDRYLKGIAAAAVYTDNRRSAFELTNALFDGGASLIGFISPPAENTSTIEDRLAGFTDAYAARGIGLKSEYVITKLYSTLPRAFGTERVRYDVETVKTFIERNPELDAFVVTEYNLALVVKEALQSLGKRVPEDHAVVCFDSPDEPFGNHPFTHVRQDEYEMGRRAVDLLQMQWEKQDVPLHNMIPYSIVAGRSAATVRNEAQHGSITKIEA